MKTTKVYLSLDFSKIFEKLSLKNYKKINGEEDILKKYKFIKTLGNGSFGKVILCEDKNKIKYSIKFLNKKRISNDFERRKVIREIYILDLIEHENICKMYKIYEDKKRIYIVLEYCENGELFDYLSDSKRFNEEETAYYFYQIVNSIHELHVNGIVHRDLKLENILLTQDKLKLKLIDFGLSIFTSNNTILGSGERAKFLQGSTEEPDGDISLFVNDLNQTNNSILDSSQLTVTSFKTKKIIPTFSNNNVHSKFNNLINTPCGSPCYVSPELLSGLPFDGYKNDMWALGVILYTLSAGFLPFNDDDKLYYNIQKAKVQYHQKQSPMIVDCIKRLLRKNVEKRYSIQDIKKHALYLYGEDLNRLDYKFKYKNDYSELKKFLKLKKRFYENESFVYKIVSTENFKKKVNNIEFEIYNNSEFKLKTRKSYIDTEKILNDFVYENNKLTKLDKKNKNDVKIIKKKKK